MTKRGRRQTPSEDDLALWETVAESVAPLKGAKRLSARATADGATTHERPTKPALSTARPLTFPPRPRPAEPPALAPLDRRMRSRVARGALPIDGRIDLHGLTQAAAHRRLAGFLRQSQEKGAKLVLVITGKGQADDRRTLGEERGVLRRLVPIWLGSEEMRPFVIGYEAAGRSHGGEGALYVRIRNRRKAGS